MTKHLGFLIAVLIAGFSGEAFALGLGKIEVLSKLNQPFEAKIPLIGMHEGDADNLKVSLASQERFKQAGVEYTPYLTGLRFEVVAKAGAAYLRVHNHVLLQEPYLSFLLQVHSSSGDVVQQYNALFDPPRP
jgi:pilus assembly protein FimV